MSAIDQALKKLVRRRARSCCEYCGLPEAYSSTLFEIEHIIAEQHGGPLAPENLALACLACNRHKGPNIAGVDPKTGKQVWLFHPRRQSWRRHFRWKGPVLVGRTAIGRATINILAVNLPYRIAQRAALIDEGLFPM